MNSDKTPGNPDGMKVDANGNLYSTTAVQIDRNRASATLERLDIVHRWRDFQGAVGSEISQVLVTRTLPAIQKILFALM